MADIDARVEVDVLEALEFEPGCEGSTHPESAYGHIAEQPATWLVAFPCGLEGLTCDGWANYHISNPRLRVACYACGQHHLVHTLRFIPIGTP